MLLKHSFCEQAFEEDTHDPAGSLLLACLLLYKVLSLCFA